VVNNKFKQNKKKEQKQINEVLSRFLGLKIFWKLGCDPCL